MKCFIILTSLILLVACGKSPDKKDGSKTISDKATTSETLENLADSEAENNPFRSFHGTYDVKKSSAGCDKTLQKLVLKRKPDQVVQFLFTIRNQPRPDEYNVFVNKHTKGASFSEADGFTIYNSGEMHGDTVRELAMSEPDATVTATATDSETAEEDKKYFTLIDTSYDSTDPDNTEVTCEFKLEKRNANEAESNQ